MLIDTIVDYCDDKYNKTECNCCTYEEYCPNNCARCLHYIHTPSSAPEKRTYDCERMACFYVCKYSHKYASELVYAFEQLKDIRDKENLKVLSVGCGPCTDLYALDYLLKNKTYSFKTLEYRGVDLNLNQVWSDIHQEIKNECTSEYSIKYYYRDAFELIDEISEKKWVPDVTIFQYVFSDMQKNASITEIKDFVNKFSAFINEKMVVNSYVILNDINLSIRFDGGREYFDRLYNTLDRCDNRKYHFDNSNKLNHFHYGEEYECNDLIFAIPEKLYEYEPFDSCASAQMIIKKGE